MTPIAQILHVLRKDLRAHWVELAGVVLLNLMLVFDGATSWAGIVEQVAGRRGLASSDSEAFIAAALILVWWVLIARLIRADLPASRKQFWLTRPYSRMPLLLAKVAAILIFVHLPMLLAQLAVLTVTAVPFTVTDLLFNQFVLAVTYSLPVATLAALSPTLRSFAFGSVLFLVLMLFVAVFSGLRGPEVHLNVGAVIDETPWAFGNWLRLIFVLIAGAVITVAALAWQYQRRETARVAAFVLAASLVVIVLLFAFPRSLITTMNSAFVGPPASPPSLQFRAAPTDRSETVLRQPAQNYYPLPAFLGGGPPDWEGVVEIPIEVLTAGARQVELGNAHVLVVTADGVEASIRAGVWRYADGRWLRFRVPAELYRRLGDERVNLELAADALVYTESPGTPIPPSGADVVVAGHERCGIAWGAMLICRAAFADSGGLRRAIDLSELAAGKISIWNRDIASIRLTIAPVADYRRSINVSSWQIPNIPDNRRIAAPLAVGVVRPSGYVRVSLTLDDIRLSDWSL